MANIIFSNSTFLDYPDNESLANLIFFMKCDHNCINCQNKDFQINNSKSKNYNDVDMLIQEMEILKHLNNTNKFIFSGGDPLHPDNICFVKEVLNKTNTIFDISIYTGYNINYVKKNKVKGFKFIKTERYREDLKQYSFKNNKYFVLASSNQKIFDSEYRLLTKKGILKFK